MYVIKRNNQKENVSFDKILRRITNLCDGLSRVDPAVVARQVTAGVYTGVRTTELDKLASDTAANMASHQYEYGMLAARIAISDLHKTTCMSFSENVARLHGYIDPNTGTHAPLVSDELLRVVTVNSDRLDDAISYERDFEYDYFGFKTLERSYLLKIDGNIAERPQQMLMRVCLGIHGDDVDSAIESYDLMSQGYFTHASPTLFNAGTPSAGLSSCFLLTVKDDSIDGIFDTLKQCAMISKSAGGIGLSTHNVRSAGSYIRGTNGNSNGIVPMLRVFNNTARYVDQGGGKRKGAFAIYLEPWHADIFDFLDMRKATGAEELRARDLFYALWINDIFMRRVESDGVWSLMSPNESTGLFEVYGDEFDELYESYESAGSFVRQVKARDLWQAILDSQVETGTPYMLYKDASNRKSNQKNLGTIRSSNLCTEVMQYSSADEVAVCNLASIALPRFVSRTRFHDNHDESAVPTRRHCDDGEDGRPSVLGGGEFNHRALYDVVRVIVRNLNMVIDRNYYPVEEARRSNMRHRPMGIGVQGLADVFMMLGLPYESDGARRLNIEIFETIYYAALSASCEQAAEDGPYESYDGSPASQGVLQYDMWNVEPGDRWNWDALKARIAEHGLRNSLLVAPMPTASTAQILGNTESFEPLSSNMYMRRTMAGEFAVVNTFLMSDLEDLGLWTPDLRRKLLMTNGSVQGIEEIPDEIKALYRTVWEMKGRNMIDMSADRGAFICQSQSFNMNMANYNFGKMTSYHFHAWRKGLKTGMYYFRTKETAQAQKPMLDQKLSDDGDEEGRQRRDKEMESMLCSLDNQDACVSCGS